MVGGCGAEAGDCCSRKTGQPGALIALISRVGSHSNKLPENALRPLGTCINSVVEACVEQLEKFVLLRNRLFKQEREEGARIAASSVPFSLERCRSEPVQSTTAASLPISRTKESELVGDQLCQGSRWDEGNKQSLVKQSNNRGDTDFARTMRSDSPTHPLQKRIVAGLDQSPTAL